MQTLRVSLQNKVSPSFADTDAQARLAELENQANGKQANVKSEQRRSTASIKRERDDQENEPQRKRSRQSGPIETVDLTDD